MFVWLQFARVDCCATGWTVLFHGPKTFKFNYGKQGTPWKKYVQCHSGWCGHHVLQMTGMTMQYASVTIDMSPGGWVVQIKLTHHLKHRSAHFPSTVFMFIPVLEALFLLLWIDKLRYLALRGLVTILGSFEVNVWVAVLLANYAWTHYAVVAFCLSHRHAGV
jgi:hypothetical protein